MPSRLRGVTVRWPAKAACAAFCASRSSFFPRRRRSCRRRNLQNLDPHGLNEAKQAGPIAAGGLDPDPLDLTEGSHPSQHLSVALPGRGKALAPQNTVAFIDDGRDMQILMGVHAANDMSLCWVPDVHSEPPWCDRASNGSARPSAWTGQSRDQMVRPFSGHRHRRGKASPQAFPGGRRVQGKTRLVDRSVGQTTPRHLAAPAYQAVDRCWSQTAQELASIH